MILRMAEISLRMTYDPTLMPRTSTSQTRSNPAVPFRNAVMTAKPKTSSGEDRVVALGPGLIGVLMAHRERQDADRVAADGAWQDTGLVFTRADGSGWAPDTVSYWFQKLAKEAGLRRVRFHDLRHGTASLALANGVDMAVVSKMLGHSTLAFTVDRYTHLLEGTGRRAAIAVETGRPRGLLRDRVTNL